MNAFNTKARTSKTRIQATYKQIWHCRDLLMKLTQFTKQAQLDTDAIHRKQIYNLVSQTVRQWLQAGK